MIFNSITWFRDSAPQAAFGVSNVFLAAANVRGAWIVSAFLRTAVPAGAVPYVELTWGTTAPTAINNRNTIIAVYDVTLLESAGNDAGRFSLVKPYFIPAGNGLWFAIGSSENAAFRSCGYQLL